MEEGILAIVWLIIFSVSGLIMIVFLRKYTNEERMALIEKGMSPSDLKTANISGSFGALRFSLLLIGFGMGLLVGYFLDQAFYMREVGYFSMLFIFGGGGLGAAYVIEDRKSREDSAS